jgi:hypothetical protein
MIKGFVVTDTVEIVSEMLDNNMQFFEVIFSIFDISGQSEQSEAVYSCLIRGRVVVQRLENLMLNKGRQSLSTPCFKLILAVRFAARLKTFV